MRVTRREVLKTAAAASALAAIGGPLTTVVKAAANEPDEWVKSVCRFCGTGCGVMVGIKGGKVVTVKGDPNNHNKGFLCLKGALMPPIVYSKDRVTQPYIRKNGKLEPASWDEAMSLVTSKFKGAIKDHGPESVAYYGSGQCLTEETYLASKIFKAGLGSNNVEGNPRLCMASAVGGYVTTFGKDEPCGSYKDIDAATCFFIIGSNMSECHPVLFKRVAARKQADPNVKIIVVDPRKTNTGRIADEHVSFKPGTDLAILNAMAHVIINEEIDNPRFHGKYVSFMTSDKKKVDFDAYVKFLADYSPEKAEKISGVPADQIRRIAKMFAEASGTTSFWCMGLNQRIRGVWANNLVSNLHLLTGQIGKPGATPFSLTGQPNACGGVRDTGGLCHLLPAGRLIKKPEHRAQVEKQWGLKPGTIAPKPGLHTVALWNAFSEAKVKAMFVICTNPAHSLPNVNIYTEGMKRKDNFMVLSEPFMDAETVKYADVLLPSAFWCEKRGTYGCSERRYSLLKKSTEPLGECKPDFDILMDFAKRMGVDPKVTPYKEVDDVWNEWREVSSITPYNFKGMTRARMEKASGILWPCPTEDHPGTNIRYVRGEDPNIPKDYKNKYHFYGKPDGRAVIWFRPYKPAAEEPDADYPMVLTTGRVIDHWHTGTMTMKVPELRRSFPKAYVEVNVDDAKAAGIKNGDDVVLETRRDTMTFQAKVSDVCRPGLVFVPWYDVKLLINKLTLNAFDPGSKQPEYKICAIRIKKA
ncbi:MAG: nitrate reductase [Thermodesulfobacteriota bacterium]